MRKVLISGAGGLIGRALSGLLRAEGWEVIPLSRRPAAAGQVSVQWDPEAGVLPGHQLENLDAVVHLAGENVAGGRWTAARKERIRRSRVEGTDLLCRGLAALERRPSVLVCASAVGFYGDRGDEVLDEESAAGAGFLAEVTQEWEAAAEPAREAGIRVAHLRLGTVLSPEGGALARMLPPFRLGLGGRVGRGRQIWSWLSLEDAASAAVHCLHAESLAGPVNAVSPEPVTNAAFTAALGRALGRPTLFPVPALVLDLLFGEMGRTLLLASARVRPKRLLETGFAFAHPRLDAALADLLNPSQR